MGVLRTFKTVQLTLFAVLTCIGAGSSASDADCPPHVKQTITLSTSTTAATEYQASVLNLGNWVLGIDNKGYIGGTVWEDYFTGEYVEVASEFPKYSLLHNIYDMGFWVGGILDGDTLVSAGPFYDTYNGFCIEWNPVPGPAGELNWRSAANPDMPGYDEAVSEQDFIVTYTDTIYDPEVYYDDLFTGFAHLPLGLEIEQSAYVWSGALIEDIVLFNVKVKNVGDKPIEDAYFGIYTRPMIGFTQDYG